MPATGREENLVKITSETAAELGSRGGKKSAKVKQQQRDLRRAMQVLLEASYKVPVRDETTNRPKINAKGLPVTKKVSGAELIATMVMNKAVKGDLHAFELVRDTAGQKPIERHASADVPLELLAEVERLVAGEDDDEEEGGDDGE